MGEFGRTPKVNDKAGRDHWEHCYTLCSQAAAFWRPHRRRQRRPATEHPHDHPPIPADVAATVHHADRRHERTVANARRRGGAGNRAWRSCWRMTSPAGAKRAGGIVLPEPFSTANGDRRAGSGAQNRDAVIAKTRMFHAGKIGFYLIICQGQRQSSLLQLHRTARYETEFPLVPEYAQATLKIRLL